MDMEVLSISAKDAVDLSELELLEVMKKVLMVHSVKNTTGLAILRQKKKPLAFWPSLMNIDNLLLNFLQ